MWPRCYAAAVNVSSVLDQSTDMLDAADQPSSVQPSDQVYLVPI
jgi:hypothetical protein